MQAENTALLRHKAALRLTDVVKNIRGVWVFMRWDEKAIS
jgi:hypothetical protein